MPFIVRKSKPAMDPETSTYQRLSTPWRGRSKFKSRMGEASPLNRLIKSASQPRATTLRGLPHEIKAETRSRARLSANFYKPQMISLKGGSVRPPSQSSVEQKNFR